MKKVLLVFSLLMGIGLFSMADNESPRSVYKLDERKLENAFVSAEDITVTAKDFYSTTINGTNNNFSSVKSDSPQQTAAIVALIQCLTGIGAMIPIHRFILGTAGQGVKIFFLYFCTFSGCGVILLVDTIFLLIHMDESNYVDNPNFIMWKGDM